MFEKTTQFMHMPSSTYLRKHHHSTNLTANVYQHCEADTTDTIFSDTPAVNGGEKAAQLFVGCTTKLASVHPLKNTGEKALLGAFDDHVRWHGAPKELCAENDQVYEGSFFMKYVCDLWIWLWQSESYHQQQNYVDNIWQSLKYGTNRLIDFTGKVSDLFFCAMVFNYFIWNHTLDPEITIGNHLPYTFATGCSNNISPLLCFRFNEPVYCLVDPKE